MREPMILGHESAGVVSAIGYAVEGFHIGDRVALEVGQPCGSCERCKEGRYNICKDMNFRASARRFPHCQGTLQERVNMPAEWCHKLPDDVSLEVGALLEPMSVALHASRRATLTPDSTVLVFGAGAVGLLAAAMAKVHGAREVIIADIDPGRLDFAIEHRFADSIFTIPVGQAGTIEQNLDIAKEVAASIGSMRSSGRQTVGEVDRVFECTGAPSCVQAAIFATRPGGRIVLVGMGNPTYTLPVSAAALREIDLVGSFRYANTYPECIKIVSRQGLKLPDFSKLVTHRFRGLEKADEAFRMAGKTIDSRGKLVLKIMVDLGEFDKPKL